MKKIYVNDAVVEPQEIQARLEQMIQFYARQGVPQEALKEHLDDMVQSAREQAVGARLVALEATARGLAEGELVASVLKDVPEPTDAEVRAYFDANKDAFVTPPEVKASHILVKTEGLDDAGKEKARAKLAGIRANIRNEINVEAAFAAAARENSDCPSGQQGGDLGWFRRGMMVPEFDAASFSMKEGELSDIIETSFGYHIILKTGAREGGPQPFEACKDAIREGLAGEARNRKFAEFVGALREKAKIEVRDV